MNKNGVFKSFGVIGKDLDTIDYKILNPSPRPLPPNRKCNYDSPMAWGIFKVERDKIIIERWMNASHFPLPIAMSTGKIINNRTIHMEMFGDKKFWKFRQFSPKPDSISIFIK